MYQYLVQLAHAITKCCQVHHSLAKIAHLQFHVDIDQSANSLRIDRELIIVSEEYTPKVQVHTVHVGSSELLAENEGRYGLPRWQSLL